MRFLRRYRLFGFLLFLVLFGLLSGKFLLPKILRAQVNGAPTDGKLAEEIDEFASKGADAYIVWQYSGAQNMAWRDQNDQYSFFKDSPQGNDICKIFKEKSVKIKIGVNMHSLAMHLDAKDDLVWLNKTCGVTVARIFGNKDERAVVDAVALLNANGIEAIVAFEDYANEISQRYPGNPTPWYQSEYFTKDEYYPRAERIARALRSKNLSVYALELANEPHCNGNPGCPDAYFDWAQKATAGLLGAADYPMALGQMANNDIGLGDSPGIGHFFKSNSFASVAKASAHYYTPAEKAGALKALDEAKRAGKTFYIGEAPPRVYSDRTGAAEQKAPYFEYNINRDVPADNQKILGNFLDEYSVTCMPKESYIIADNSSAPGGIANCIKSLLLLDGKGIDGKSKDQCQGWGASGTLKISANNKLFGLFRSEEKVKQRVDSGNDSNKRSRLESLESFFSARTTIDQDETTQTKESTQAGKKIEGDISPYQAPLYKLTNFTQQCQFIYDKLQAIRFLCDPKNRIKGDDTVCLINEEIAGTSLKALDVLQRMEMTGTPANCQALMYPDPKSQGYKEAQDLRSTILKINPTLEMAYRPAFVVAVTKTNTKPNKPENRLYFANKDETDFWAVDFLEIKVPAFGSDFLDPEAQRPGPQIPQMQLDKKEIAARTYKDPLRLTADIFTSNTNQVNFVKAETDMRNLVRAEDERLRLGTSQPRIIGTDQLPIKCGTGGNYGKCDELGQALANFINAQVGLTTEATANNPLKQFNSSWKVPCQANEEDFYPNVFNDSKENRIAEKAESIGSKLETQIIGDLKKQKEILVSPKTYADWSNAEGNFSQPGMPVGTTQVFFVTPHNYTLNYSQTAFLSLLSMDQQQKLFQSGSYNALLKTGEIDDWKGSGDSFPVRAPASTTKEDPDTLKNPPGKYIGNASNTLIRDVKDGKDRMTSLLWQFGGSIANVPTRLYTLITTSPSSPLHKFTVACEKEGELATEKWFLGKCAVPKEPETKSTCEGGQVTACYNFEGECGQCGPYEKDEDICLPNPKSGRGQVARISDGIIRLALKVSKETCVPAEMIVAVVAKERSGVYARNGSLANQGDLVPLNGDPNQLPIYGGNFALYASDPKYKITEDPYVMCKKIDDPQAFIKDPRLYVMDCGPTSYSQEVFDNQVKVYDPNGAIIQSCLNAIGVKDSDARRVGVNMCAAAAELWRGVYLSKNWDRSRSLNAYRGTTYGCGPSSFSSAYRGGDLPSVPKQAYSLAELRNQGYDDASFADGFYSFSKNREASQVNETYFSFMKAFQAQVEKIRAEGDTCGPATN